MIHSRRGVATTPDGRVRVSEGQGGGSTVRRIQLGSRLRALRVAKGLSREEAGHPIRASESKISRMELGRVGFKERDVADLLTLYGVQDIGGARQHVHATAGGERAQLVAGVRRLSMRGSRATSTWNGRPS